MNNEMEKDALYVLLDKEYQIKCVFYLNEFDAGCKRQKVLPIICESEDGFDFYYSSPVKLNLEEEFIRKAFMSDLMFTFEHWKVVDGLNHLYTLDIVVGSLLNHLYGLVPSERAVETFLQAWEMYRSCVVI